MVNWTTVAVTVLAMFDINVGVPDEAVGVGSVLVANGIGLETIVVTGLAVVLRFLGNASFFAHLSRSNETYEAPNPPRSTLTPVALPS
ncbi:hypothetical protein BKA61DRAFT_616282 [Leptodontidium sp. MPI-SDFR-AT-0119]|nr:hypothetical protein BKA61DRAFT_616282 [Leptodontidium sp. MPI-SDFR-AT-0119]